ncbi:hypothetical protein ABZ816_12345 [Actinosynnema sp. NPDC047251]|uniref:Uncharacterized protein n=1 Tax=Saccharothrix espanaensis (strain ATCC 51144 / DSM 44229 / JCM 9112 / NBRC 15066 / NRRL 15764) TaxID=1179773 RepID=K0KCU5_SACES|nr:hypothetical protein [Saccharothrix espanaensis]CCH35387.1 hypothetical protein BN6_81700 [Saccharothrix espanaensis DSM 44229]
MGDFFAAALAFPTVVLSIPLVVVVLFWLLAAFGVDLDGGVELAYGLGGVPTSVVVSLLVPVAWFACLAGTTLVDGFDIAILAGSLAVGYLVARLAVIPLRHLYPTVESASRNDFVGKVCVIRTGTVTASFGQAEVTADDGSSAIVQVRQAGQDPLTAGVTALIFDYDQDGEFFWVAPIPTYPLGEH